MAEPASFEWYGSAIASQHGASYVLFKFLADNYGESIMHKLLNNLRSTMTSNHRCDTFEQCALLAAVYDANGRNMNDKKQGFNFDAIMQEWEDYQLENYVGRTKND